MQALWSRAGQAHRCGCRACESVVSSLGRRVTTAARPRKVTFADIFTACYSSMFATAAIVDAVRKEDRRQELDRQLEETRRELAQLKLRNLEAAQANNDADLADIEVSLYQMDHLWDAIKSLYTNRPYMKEIYKPATIRIDEFLNRVHTEEYECPDEATMEALRRTDYDHLEQVIMREETDDTIHHRRPLNSDQLRNAECTLSHLIQQLLKRAHAHDKSNSPSPSFDDAMQLAKDKSSSRFLVETDPERVTRNRVDLNSRLRDVVSSQLNLKEKVGRICYNLLVSAYPADMHTYNTLIVAFDKHGYKYLSEPVVNSFYYYRRLRPTPSTFVAILNHYKNSGNHGRFLRSLASLAGLDGETGAKLGRRIADETERVPRSRHGNNKGNVQTWTQTGDYFWEHAPLDKPIIETAIQGLLHMKLFDQAAEFFVSCMRAKVVLSTHVIRQLFDECIVALDWRSAVRLIQGFTDCSKTWPSMLLGRDQDTSYLISRLRVLLDLAGLRGVNNEVSKSTLDNLSISSGRFHQFLSDLAATDSTSQSNTQNIVTTTQDSDSDLISSSKRRLLQIEALWKEQDLVGKSTRSIESKILYPEFSPAFRSSMAFHIGNAAADQTVELNGEIMEVLSQLPLSAQVEGGIAECKALQKSSGARDESSAVFEKIKESRRTLSEVRAGKEVGMFLQDEELDLLSAQKAITVKRMNAASTERRPLRARAMRLSTWPVTDQQVEYLERASFG